MLNLFQETLFGRALRGERTERPPVWLMRQAGRSDPAYRLLRESFPLELEELFLNVEFATHASLLPLRWGVDALIIFQDILTLCGAIGAPFIFRPGPVIVSPIKTLHELGTLHRFDPVETLPHIATIFTWMRRHAGDAIPLLGFAGAPLTILSFLLEGSSPGPTIPKTRQFLTHYAREAHATLAFITEMTIEYLKYQSKSGATVVQLFESAAQWFSRHEYLEFALPYQQQVISALKGVVPTIFFARLTDTHILLEDLNAAGADVLSLPSTCTIKEARRQLGESLVVQGNFNNQLLAGGSTEAIAEQVLACILSGECRGHIFNLDHGILANTPHENVLYLVKSVRSFRTT